LESSETLSNTPHRWGTRATRRPLKEESSPDEVKKKEGHGKATSSSRRGRAVKYDPPGQGRVTGIPKFKCPEGDAEIWGAPSENGKKKKEERHL